MRVCMLMLMSEPDHCIFLERVVVWDQTCPLSGVERDIEQHESIPPVIVPPAEGVTTHASDFARQPPREVCPHDTVPGCRAPAWFSAHTPNRILAHLDYVYLKRN